MDDLRIPCVLWFPGDPPPDLSGLADPVRLPVRVVWREDAAALKQRPTEPLSHALPSEPPGNGMRSSGSVGNIQLAESTMNPDYAAKMLGYDRKTFGGMIHDLKPYLGLSPADNLIFHDNGDVYSGGNHVGNIHDFAP